MADKSKSVEKVMFFRSDLETIVWDEDREKRIRFNRNNQFVTNDRHLIKKLDRLGYPRVPLDAEVPPPIPDRPVKDVGDIKILPKGATEDTELQRIKRESILKDKEAQGAGSGGAKKPGRKITRRER